MLWIKYLEDVESEEEYECGCGFSGSELTPQRYTTYDDEGYPLESEWLVICPQCGNILE